MTIFIPLTIILAGAGYFGYQTYQWAKKWKYQHQKTKRLKKELIILGAKPSEHEIAELDHERIIPYQKPLFFNWKDQICFKLFGRQTWIRYRESYSRAKFAVNCFYPTVWLGFFGLFSVLTGLFAKLLLAWPLNWFFWVCLGALPILGIMIFYQYKRLKQIPANERSNYANN